MQKASGRSPALIARNLGDRGHLSNGQGAELVRSSCDVAAGSGSAHLVLLHLSEQCNRPELAIRGGPRGRREAGRRRPIHAARQAPAHPNLQIGRHRRVGVRRRRPGVPGVARPARAR